MLEWGEWDCSQTIGAFAEEFEKIKDESKNIMLLPVESNSGRDSFKDIIRLECPKGKLGLWIQDTTVTRSYYQNQILNRYIHND